MKLLQYLPILMQNNDTKGETSPIVIIGIVIVFLFIGWLIYNFDKLNK